MDGLDMKIRQDEEESGSFKASKMEVKMFEIFYLR